MGGAEYFLLDFLGALSATEVRRLQPLVLGGACDLYQQRLPDNINRTDFVLPAVKGGKLSKIKALLNLVWCARRLKSILKTEKATQVFTNTPRAHLVLFLLKKVWGWKGTWIVMVHDFTLRPESLMTRIGASAEVTIANSLPTRAWLKTYLNKADYEKIRLIENGVKVGPQIQPAQQLMTLLHLSRIDKRKGQQHFVEAADLLQDRNPDLKFSVVGDSVKTDPETVIYEQDVRQFAQDRCLQNLTFKPGVKTPLATMDAYDAFVFTPTEPETFGRVVIEALSRGKLVLAYNQTGPKEILEHYERWLQQTKNLSFKEPHLLLVELNNAMSLAERMAYFADNPSEVHLYTKYAAEFVAENYSLAETKKRLAEVLLV